MNKETLKTYRSVLRQIGYLSNKIAQTENKEVETVKGKVKGSMQEFPYVTTSYSVDLYDPIESKKKQDRLRRLIKERDELRDTAERIEIYVDLIMDIETKEIFRYIFLEGMRQEDVSRILNLDRSRISKKISDQLKKAQKTQSSTKNTK